MIFYHHLVFVRLSADRIQKVDFLSGFLSVAGICISLDMYHGHIPLHIVLNVKL